ncbi:hypothetical protein [uncultured Acetobacteroides sp.]|nr:hypothetical protein [uncultured Acetobacteroides sp.]
MMEVDVKESTSRSTKRIPFGGRAVKFCLFLLVIPAQAGIS